MLYREWIVGKKSKQGRTAGRLWKLLEMDSSFCESKDTVMRVKRKPIEREKIFANHISGKRLISKICKEVICQ